MSLTEHTPTLQSMSIRAFVSQLEDQDNRSPSSSFSRKHRASPPCNFFDDDETMSPPPLLADIQPRTLSPWTVLARSTVTTELDCREVLRRIETCIHRKSLTYTVDLETASVECQTPCNLCFALYFWINDQGKVLVEIQRRHGCAILMQRVRKTLFCMLLPPRPIESCSSSSWREEEQQATTEEEEAWQRCPRRCMTVSPRVKQMMMERERDHENEQQESQVVQESLAICEEQLCSERLDLNQLALESLVHMTDPNKSSPMTAKYVSQALLCESSPEDNNNNHLHEEFVHTLCSAARHYRRESFKYEYAGMTPLEEGQYNKTMAFLSQKALYNAMKVALAWGGSWIDSSSHSWQCIIATLQANINNAMDQPQEATMADRCMGLLNEIVGTPRRTTLRREICSVEYSAAVHL